MSAGDIPGYQQNDAYTQDDWNEVLDTPELTAEQVRDAKPFAEVFPEIAERVRRARGPQKSPTKTLVSLRLDRRVIEHYKAGGEGWQSRINEALLKTAGF